MTWREYLLDLNPGLDLAEPASPEAIARADEGLRVELPADLRDLLLETDGVTDEYGYLPAGVYWAVALITLTLLALAVLLDSCLVGLLLIFPAPFVGYWLYGRLLILLARLSGTGRGVLVYSDSPYWREYIETGWLPHCAETVTVLNWSRRKQWKTSPAVLVFRHFCGTEENFNPSVVLFRGLRRPLVFCFYYAFRDARHGKRAPLEGLERRLFEEFGAPWEPGHPQSPGEAAPGDSVSRG